MIRIFVKILKIVSIDFSLPYTQVSNDIQCDFRHSGVKVMDSVIIEGQKSLRAIEFIPAETVIFIYENEVSDIRTRTSIQVADMFHIEAGDFASYTNHSCQPNAVIVSECDKYSLRAKVMLVTISNIEMGDEIQFDYASTESTLTQELLHTPCLCGAKECRGVLTGFNELPEQHKKQIRSKAQYL